MWSNKGRSRAVRSHFGRFPCGRPTKSSRLWLKGQRRASFCYNYYCYCADDPLPAVGAPLFPFPLPGCRLLPGGTDTRPLPLFRRIWPGFACKTVAISARVWYDNRNFLHPAQPPPVHFGLFPAARSPAPSEKRAGAGTAAHSRPWPPGSANPCRAGRPAELFLSEYIPRSGRIGIGCGRAVHSPACGGFEGSLVRWRAGGRASRLCGRGGQAKRKGANTVWTTGQSAYSTPGLEG